MFWATFFAIARKEFMQLRRNKMIVRMVATLQITQLVLLGFIDTNARDLPTVVVDQDQSSYSRELVQKLRATETFDVRFSTSSIAQARGHIRAGRAKIALIIPPEFHRERARHAESHILALVDGTDATASGQALSAIDGLSAQIKVDTEQTEREPAVSSVVPHSILLFNPKGLTSNFVLPGLLAIILMNAYMGLPAMALVRERQNGTLERLLMTPMSFTGFMIGKLAPYSIAGIANASVLLLAMRWLFHVPIQGNPILLLGACAIYLFTVLAVGMYIASTAPSEQAVGVKAGQLGMPMMFLCGYIFPLSSVPKWLLPVAYALPPTHMIEIIRGIALRDASISDLWVHFLYLFLAPVVLLTVAVKKFTGTINA